MKKWMIAFALLSALLIASTYIFIPRILTISRIEPAGCNTEAAYRCIIDSANWEKWNLEKANRESPEKREGLGKREGPEKRNEDSGKNKNYYHLANRFYHEAEITIRATDLHINSRVLVFPRGGKDSVNLQWKCNIVTSNNPFKRIQQYRQALRIRDEISYMLSLVKDFLGDKKNVYGMDVKDAMSKDSCLVVSKIKTDSYPGTEIIYRTIGALRQYLTKEGAKEIDYPMMNVSRIKGGEYETMIAIPIDRALKGDGPFFPKNFVPWKILTGEVMGGNATAERAMDQLEQYIMDYQRTAMAIPFQLLVTERNREPDTSRWITRVVVPVF